VNDRIRPQIAHAGGDLVSIGEIVVSVSRRFDVLIAALVQNRKHLAPKKARATRDQDARLMLGRHGNGHRVNL
jgi:hypothetical protein